MTEFAGFVGDAYTAASIYQNDQELINWYCEIDQRKEQGERGRVTLYPTPGLVVNKTSSTIAEVRALYTASGGTALFAVVGNVVYMYDTSYTETSVGTLSSSSVSGPVSITDNGVSVYFTDGSNRYACTITGTGFAQISGTDGAFTGGVRSDIVDNYIIYNRPTSQQWGCTNALSTVSGSLNFSSKDGSSDNLISLIVANREIFLLGERTGEVWTDTGSFPFPFSRLSGASMQHGCAAPFSIARLGEAFAFLSKDDRGQNIVARMVGYQPKRISTFAVEDALSKYSTISDAIAYSYQEAGHEFYVLTFPTADATWCFDLATELWHKRAWRDANNVLHRHRGNCAAFFNGQVVIGDYQNGNIYRFSRSIYTDNGDIIPCIRRAPHLVKDYNRVFYQSLQLYFQPGVGIQSGQGSNPQAILEWSDDGGSTYGNQHFASLGKVGKYKNRTIWRQLGSARDRIFQVTVTDPVNRVLVSADLQAQAGAW
jgi:hypothetical protein